MKTFIVVTTNAYPAKLGILVRMVCAQSVRLVNTQILQILRVWYVMEVNTPKKKAALPAKIALLGSSMVIKDSPPQITILAMFAPPP